MRALFFSFFFFFRFVFICLHAMPYKVNAILIKECLELVDAFIRGRWNKAVCANNTAIAARV